MPQGSIFEKIIQKRMSNDGSLIPRSLVEQGMLSNDIKTLGATYGLLVNSAHRIRVTPPIDDYDCLEFFHRYFSRCFIEDPTQDWTHSRYVVGWDLANLMKVWSAESRSQELIAKTESWLREVYLSTSDEIRTCIVHATLEHAFESRKLRRHFANWKSHPSLRNAYEEASLWGDAHRT